MNKTERNKSLHLRKLTAVSLFCALAYICVFLIRFKVSFLTFDLKDAVMAIGAMYFGPVSGILMPTTVSLIEFLTISDTGVYGLIMNFISSVSFCFVSSIIYKFQKKLSGAIIALVSAVLVTTGIMMTANLLITPYYMGVTVTDVSAMIPTLLLPFNLIKGIVNASVVMLLYKYFSKALGRYLSVIGFAGSGNTVSEKSAVGKSHKAIISFVTLTILIVALFFLFYVLNATLE